MRRIAAAVAVAVLAITLIVTSLVPAQGTHTLGHLRRQIARLENQVASLRRDVADLNIEVFRCEFFDDASPTTFADGTIGFPLNENSLCVAAARR